MAKDISDRFLLIPDSVFFIKILEADVSLSAADASSMADTFLESSSPFPTEVLCRGVSRLKNRVLLYASPLERLLKVPAFAERQALAQYALPACALFAKAPLKDGWSICKAGSSLCALFFAYGVLKEVCAHPSGAAEEDPEALRKLCEFAGIRDGIYGYYELAKISSSGPLYSKFTLTDLRAANTVSWRIKNSVLAGFMDVRNTDTLRAVSKAKFYSMLSKAGAYAAVAAFAVLAAWQCGIYVQRAYASSETAHLDEIAPQAHRVEIMSEQLSFLKTFSQETLFNAYMLGVINKYRPSSVEFIQVTAKSPLEMQIKGKADSIDSVNKFVEVVKADPAISGVEANIPISKTGNAQFILTVSFNKK